MKMRTLLLLKCTSSALVCVGVCAHQFSKVSLHALSHKTLLSAYLFARICFRFDFAMYSSFIFKFPLEVKMFFVGFFYFSALAIPCSQWSDKVFHS